VVVKVKVNTEGGDGDSNGIFGADWTPVVRSVGAFVGIAYAIRKLPWSTPLQASLTLFLVNPFLWYLLDRSIPGFLLSASIGGLGTALLLLTSPSLFPSPLSPLYKSLNFMTAAEGRGKGEVFGGWGGMAVKRETIEGGIWILSVLFCSAVCFGNIGRRLALSGLPRKPTFTNSPQRTRNRKRTVR